MAARARVGRRGARHPGRGAERSGSGPPAARLGASPSALADGDAGAAAQRQAGYEATDYAALFEGAGPFLVTVAPGRFALRPAAEVSAVGHLRVRQDRLCTFDPLDSAHRDRTVMSLDRDVPAGEHPVHVARVGGALAAALVLFGDAPVHAWAPVRFDAEQNPMPIPPVLPMAQVRYSLGLGDAATIEELVADATRPWSHAQENILRAAMGEELLAADDVAPDAVVDEIPDLLAALVDELRGSQIAVVGGVFGAPVEGPAPASWGLDESGAVAAVAAIRPGAVSLGFRQEALERASR